MSHMVAMKMASQWAIDKLGQNRRATWPIVRAGGAPFMGDFMKKYFNRYRHDWNSKPKATITLLRDEIEVLLKVLDRDIFETKRNIRFTTDLTMQWLRDEHEAKLETLRAIKAKFRRNGFLSE